VQKRRVEASTPLVIVRTVVTPPGPGGLETSRPPMPFATIFALRPGFTRAIFTSLGPAGAEEFLNLAILSLLRNHGAGIGSEPADGVSL